MGELILSELESLEVMEMVHKRIGLTFMRNYRIRCITGYLTTYGKLTSDCIPSKMFIKVSPRKNCNP
jgi:hypothetical protein